MQGPVTLKKFTGEALVLPESSYIEGGDLSATVPAIDVEGRDGAVFDAAANRYRSRTLKLKVALVSNTLSGAQVYGVPDVDAAIHEIAAFLGLGRVKLYRWTNDQLYQWVALKSMNISYRTGYGKNWADLSLTLQLDDPYFYADDITRTVAAGAGPFAVSHAGNVPQNALIYLKPRTGILVNPRITHAATGAFLEYAGTIAAGRALAVFWEKRAAYLTDASLAYFENLWGVEHAAAAAAPTVIEGALNEINDEWIFSGLPLIPGANSFTFSDDASSGHDPEYTFSRHARYV